MIKASPNKIYLIGFMASGKTTLAKKLSKYLQYSFLDTDKLIEQQEGKTISQIFKDNGEEYFRDLEAKVLNKISISKSNIVISTGGGMACKQNNLDFMLSNGKVVFLQLDLNSIINRLKNAKTKRPLLTNLNDIELEKKITNLYNDRIKFYEQAHLTINSFNLRSISLEDLIKKL